MLATDPKTGTTIAQTATATIIGKGNKNLVKITLSELGKPGGKSTTITSTDGHPFWVPTLRTWVEAKNVQVGTWLQTSTGTWSHVQDVQHWSERITVHNLTVSDTHTYYVQAGATSALVHNCGTVYRGDTRSPDEIKSAGGFMPTDPDSDTSLGEYVESHTSSRFVSTSRHAQTAAGFPHGARSGYVYEIRGAPGGIDVNEKMGGLNPNSHEAETAFDGGIPWQYVTRVWRKDEWGEVDFDYDEPIWQR